MNNTTEDNPHFDRVSNLKYLLHEVNRIFEDTEKGVDIVKQILNLKIKQAEERLYHHLNRKEI